MQPPTPPQRTVLIVGAGASVAHAKALGRAKEEWPPLDATFLTTAPSWGKVTAQMFRDRVQQYLATTTLEPYRMEQVFSYAYMDSQYHELCVMKEGTAERLLRAWQQSADFLEALIHELRLALAMTTNPLPCGAAEGALGPILGHLLDECAGSLTIVTFNQHLLIERALEELHHANGHRTPNQFPDLYVHTFDLLD